MGIELPNLIARADAAFAKIQHAAASEMVTSLRASGAPDHMIREATEGERWRLVLEHGEILEAIQKTVRAKSDAAMADLRTEIMPSAKQEPARSSPVVCLPAPFCLQAENAETEMPKPPNNGVAGESISDIIGEDFSKALDEWSWAYFEAAKAKVFADMEGAETAVSVRAGDIVALNLFVGHMHQMMWAQLKAIGQKRRELDSRVTALETKSEKTISDHGVWKSDTEYPPGAAVSHGGGLWIAKMQTTGCRPGDGALWRLAVKKGSAT